MKKTFLTLTCLFIITSFVFAQNLRIYRNDTLLANNSVLNITGDNSLTIVQYLFVKNIANLPVDVKVKKIYNNIVSGSENTFCFGMCYEPSIFVSDIVTIAPNAFDTTFDAKYSANGKDDTDDIDDDTNDVKNADDTSNINEILLDSIKCNY